MPEEITLLSLKLLFDRIRRETGELPMLKAIRVHPADFATLPKRRYPERATMAPNIEVVVDYNLPQGSALLQLYYPFIDEHKLTPEQYAKLVQPCRFEDVRALFGRNDA